MAASVDNPWWNDLLKHGKDSAFAEYFEIDWTRKLLLPVLAKSYGETLDSGDLRIKTEEGRSTLKYAGLEIPVQVPEGANLTRPNEMENVLNAQPYRLAFWRKATDGINYRRFFDVSSLVGLRMDREEVFRYASLHSRTPERRANHWPAHRPYRWFAGSSSLFGTAAAGLHRG